MIIAYIGFLLASFSVIGNDVIQTLGTFLQSNRERPWWVLYIYIGGILSTILLAGWYFNSGDVAYGRLDAIARPENMTFWYLVPPILLLVITRLGIPVSTTFMILSIFSSQVVITSMVLKSFMGYLVSFVTAILLYSFVLHRFEKTGADSGEPEVKNEKFWTVFQWLSTAFLWSQWLIQDFANIYVFLPRRLDFSSMILSLLVMLVILAFIVRMKGGAIQKVVSNKSNSSNIRSATFVDLVYGFVLLFFTMINDIPMSTTWAFVGILAGREIALRHRVFEGTMREGVRIVRNDFVKVFAGVVISVVMIVLLKESGVI